MLLVAASTVHELVQFAAAQNHLAGPAIENACEQRFLELQHAEHPFFDRSLRDEVDDLDRLLLPQPMHPADALLQHGRIPGQVHVDDDRRELQIQADATRIGRQKQPALRIVAESIDELFALVRSARRRETSRGPSLSP